MSLVVEDGTGRPDAESYISVAGASARHAALGNAAWTASEPVQEAALRRATTYMEQAYRARWSGSRVLAGQALSWPRWGVQVDGFHIASNIVPADVANACADLALRALSGDLAPDLGRAIIREKVGPLETEYESHGSRSTRYSAVDMALAPYLTGGGAMARLVRT